MFRFTLGILLTWAMLSPLASIASAQEQEGTSGELRWWKGNLHTHSFWSDGNDFPEMIADWYLQHEYNFLALSDHNTLNAGVRWFPISKVEERGTDSTVDEYVERFGDDWVEMRTTPDNVAEVRLKPLNEYAPLLQQAGKFLLLAGEEISDRAEGKPIHINVSNVKELIEPQHGETVVETLRNNLRAIIEQEKQVGQPLFPHINHPNFGYAITAEELANVLQEQFFEVYNGHPGVNQLGDAEHISIERMWDVANFIRITKLDAPPLMGIATDDCHEYHGRPGSRPGRGWVMVQSRFLTPEYLIHALRRGDFYASSGVTLESIEFAPAAKTLALSIVAKEGETYETQFIGSLRPPVEGDSESEEGAKDKDAEDKDAEDKDAEDKDAEDKDAKDEDNQLVGQVLITVTGISPSYTLTGNELYVRAVVTSSGDHPDPSLKGQKTQAWTQPVGWESDK